jgi:uncharacterized RDD family membrane protein YckC
MTQDLNRYRPPQSEVQVADDAAQPEVELASKGRRFGTLVVDFFGRMLFAALVGAATAAVYGAEALPWFQGVGGIIFGLLSFLVYYLVFEGLWARTPGKWVFGTRVIDAQGRKPAFGTIAERTLCRCIPFEPLSFIGEHGWHDKISKTRVIRVR